MDNRTKGLIATIASVFYADAPDCFFVFSVV